MTTTVRVTRTAPGTRGAFALLGSIQVTLIFTLAAIAVPLPEIGARFVLRREELVLLSAAYGLTFAGLLLFGGRLSDRWGGRRALLTGLAIFAVASAAAPLAPAYGALLAARFAQGAGAALTAPAAMAALRTLFAEPASYRRAMATWGGLSVLGATAGNLLSGVVSALLSWRWALTLPPVAATAALLLAPRVLPAGGARAVGRGGLDVAEAVLACGARAAGREDLGIPGTLPADGARATGRGGLDVTRELPPGPARTAGRGGLGVPETLPADGARTAGRGGLDVAGAVMATGGIVAASYGLVLTDAWPWASCRVLVPLAVGVVLLAGFPLVERRVRDPLLPPGFLRDGRRVRGLAATALTAAGTSTVFVLFSLHLQDVRDWSALRTSAAFLPFALALLAAGRLAGPLVGRLGPAVVAGGGLAVAAAGLALLALLGLDTGVPYAVGVLPGFLLLPAGAAASFAGAAVLATDRVPAERTGLAGSVHNAAMETGPTVVFALLLAVGGDRASLAAAAVLFACAAFALGRPSDFRSPKGS
ncbi:MFS transporter [Streptomyces sp. NPDC096205]|uniref:MFS transporter n=1 Tax=Streptomyces sp. NPDC096205 TaxID=3366081 RepID=UPI003815B781